MITVIPLPLRANRWSIDTLNMPREYRSMADFAARLTILRSSRYENCSLSIHAVSPGKIQEINRQYRNQNKSTNVLAISANALDIYVPEEIMRNLGDIFVCCPIIEKESQEYGKSFLDHLIHMIVHATLHLTGHDHENNYEANKMENRERRILNSMGIADPYSDEEMIVFS